MSATPSPPLALQPPACSSPGAGEVISPLELAWSDSWSGDPRTLVPALRVARPAAIVVDRDAIVVALRGFVLEPARLAAAGWVARAVVAPVEAAPYR